MILYNPLGHPIHDSPLHTSIPSFVSSSHSNPIYVLLWDPIYMMIPVETLSIDEHPKSPSPQVGGLCPGAPPGQSDLAAPEREPGAAARGRGPPGPPGPPGAALPAAGAALGLRGATGQ